MEALIRGASLGDSRRNARVLEIVSGIIHGQASATHGTCGAGYEAPWAHAMGAYRFFDNEQVALPALYGMVHSALAQLIHEGERCYVMHDFSWVDYAKHKAKLDRVRISNGRSVGYDLYSALVVNDRGEPLGPVAQELRTEAGCLSSQSARPMPFEGHLEQAERGVDAAREKLTGRERVHVADREFDDVHLQRWIANGDDKFIIRAQHLSRRVCSNAGLKRKLGELVESVPLQLAGTAEREGKSYEVYRGETRIEFFAPARRGITASKTRGTKRPRPQPGPTLSLRVVVAELRAKGTHEVLRWVLLTNLDDAIDVVVQAYLWRWRIERLFYLLKVGFHLEQWRQETGERIARRLALSGLCAMVIYQLQSAKGQPDVDATLKAVATLGGWLNRKGQPIGPIVLMRGLQTLLAGLAAVERLGVDGLVRLADGLGLGFAVRGRNASPARPHRKARPGETDV